MNILVLGSGGREHAITWALAKSPKAEKLYVAPGNGGMLQMAEAAVNISTIPTGFLAGEELERRQQHVAQDPDAGQAVEYLFLVHGITSSV